MDKLKLILASQSPRRKELMGFLNIPFQVQAANICEKSETADPAKRVIEIAKKKLRCILDQKDQHTIVVAADTTVWMNHLFFEKPKDLDAARKMLMQLSGKTHEVFTGVAIGQNFKQPKVVTFSCKTLVTFSTIDHYTLENYLKTNESLDKAGAYGIQGAALTFISDISGSYSNVVGFPVSRFISQLKLFLGIDEHDFKTDWRELFGGPKVIELLK